jgi:carbamoyltransferase
MGTELDVLVVGNCYLVKNDQDLNLKINYSNSFELD